MALISSRLAALALLAYAAAGSEESAPASTMSSPLRIWVDQIGYRTHGPKMAVIASDAAIPDGLHIELRDEKSGRAMWTLQDHAAALVPFNGGAKDRDSDDYIAQLDFSEVTAPGRYCFVLTAPGEVRSYRFSIADQPYHETGLAAWKALYYSRADGEKPEKYAGVWNHGKAFLGPDQDTQAKVYQWIPGHAWPDTIGTEVIDPKPYDVHGGWWDAGDFNKYTSNTVNTQNSLLVAFELAKGRAKDGELNIPESGNGVPDVLDEIRCGTEFLIRDHDGSGAAFGRVHLASGSPPESVTTVVQLTMPNSATTMARAAGLAYAAVVWREAKLDAPFASKCLEESMRSWNLIKTRPHPWPVDPKRPGRTLDQGEMGGDDDYDTWRATAAACYFRLNGGKEYDDIVREALSHRDWSKHDAAEPLPWIYLHAKGSDPALVETIKTGIISKADATVQQCGTHRGYGMSMPGYWWGSNGMVGHVGSVLVMAATITADKDRKKAYLDAAEHYVHYLLGRNPRGECYFSNMKSFGAEHSAMVMFHGWVGHAGSAYGAKYIGEGDGKIGPFPGYVIGGPNGSMKRLIEDPDLDWRKHPWEFTEPDIGYQAQVLRLLSAFTWPQEETPALPDKKVVTR